eukprot:Cvel_15478.t1-p1 / transcript=Cvel_15478.t1 / gene=Cvel_15478 / organism=Chromera_velia_CCMP2878 / gene_product=hypothetical protein / transcript_product=hypothetical protein / location=Cvel_scaffold1148:209-10088(-) / protein_length=1345 / sequence_SO=supercontig / SO=protein_coding / is_pseudo=false
MTEQMEVPKELEAIMRTLPSEAVRRTYAQVWHILRQERDRQVEKELALMRSVDRDLRTKVEEMKAVFDQMGAELERSRDEAAEKAAEAEELRRALEVAEARAFSLSYTATSSPSLPASLPASPEVQKRTTAVSVSEGKEAAGAHEQSGSSSVVVFEEGERGLRERKEGGAEEGGMRSRRGSVMGDMGVQQHQEKRNSVDTGKAAEGSEEDDGKGRAREARLSLQEEEKQEQKGERETGKFEVSQKDDDDDAEVLPLLNVMTPSQQTPQPITSPPAPILSDPAVSNVTATPTRPSASLMQKSKSGDRIGLGASASPQRNTVVVHYRERAALGQGEHWGTQGAAHPAAAAMAGGGYGGRGPGGGAFVSVYEAGEQTRQLENEREEMRVGRSTQVSVLATRLRASEKIRKSLEGQVKALEVAVGQADEEARIKYQTLQTDRKGRRLRMKARKSRERDNNSALLLRSQKDALRLDSLVANFLAGPPAFPVMPGSWLLRASTLGAKSYGSGFVSRAVAHQRLLESSWRLISSLPLTSAEKVKSVAALKTEEDARDTQLGQPQDEHTGRHNCPAGWTRALVAPSVRPPNASRSPPPPQQLLQAADCRRGSQQCPPGSVGPSVRLPGGALGSQSPMSAAFASMATPPNTNRALRQGQGESSSRHGTIVLNESDSVRARTAVDSFPYSFSPRKGSISAGLLSESQRKMDTQAGGGGGEEGRKLSIQLMRNVSGTTPFLPPSPSAPNELRSLQNILQRRRVWSEISSTGRLLSKRLRQLSKASKFEPWMALEAIHAQQQVMEKMRKETSNATSKLSSLQRQVHALGKVNQGLVRFLTQIVEALKCPVCLDELRDPVSFSGCGHSVCSECADHSCMPLVVPPPGAAPFPYARNRRRSSCATDRDGGRLWSPQNGDGGNTHAAARRMSWRRRSSTPMPPMPTFRGVPVVRCPVCALNESEGSIEQTLSQQQQGEKKDSPNSPLQSLQAQQTGMMHPPPTHTAGMGEAAETAATACMKSPNLTGRALVSLCAQVPQFLPMLSGLRELTRQLRERGGVEGSTSVPLQVVGGTGSPSRGARGERRSIGIDAIGGVRRLSAPFQHSAAAADPQQSVSSSRVLCDSILSEFSWLLADQTHNSVGIQTLRDFARARSRLAKKLSPKDSVYRKDRRLRIAHIRHLQARQRRLKHQILHTKKQRHLYLLWATGLLHPQLLHGRVGSITALPGGSGETGADSSSSRGQANSSGTPPLRNTLRARISLHPAALNVSHPLHHHFCPAYSHRLFDDPPVANQLDHPAVADMPSPLRQPQRSVSLSSGDADPQETEADTQTMTEGESTGKSPGASPALPRRGHQQAENG